MTALERSDRPRFDAYNVCRGEGVSINTLAARIQDLCGSAGPIVHGGPRPGDIGASVGDPKRAQAELGFVAAFSLDDGLLATRARGSKKR